MLKKQMNWRGIRSINVSIVPAAAFILAAVSMVLTSTMPVAAASSGGPGMVVNVPFEFYCGNKLFPTGEYTIGQGPTRDVISIQSADQHNHDWVPSIPERRLVNHNEKPTVVFTRYPDGRSYLREVRNPYSPSHYFPKSRIEHESEAKRADSMEPTPLIVSADAL